MDHYAIFSDILQPDIQWMIIETH